MPIITLLSDWGLTEHYVASAKGAILSRMPDAVIVDISHNIRQFDIKHASFVMRNAWPFFPEGTSSGGDIVRPFRAPLLQPLVDNGWNVTPAFLCYELEPGDGIVKEEVAWYRPETLFGTHFLNLLGKRRIRATVTYGETQSAGTDRKVLASRLREEICLMGGLPVEAEMVAERT